MVRVLICSFLESEHVERIRRVADVDVTFRPELIPTPRYPSDHSGAPFHRSPDQKREWARLMENADVLFDFDRVDIAGMRRHAGSVKWIQATSAGIGRYMRQHRLDELGSVVTTAAGIHARPLAEFVLWSMLAFVKRYPLARAQQGRHVWRRFCGDELEGKTLAVIGLGNVGREVARVASRNGVHVIATRPSARTDDDVAPYVERLVPRRELGNLLGTADFVCLCLPDTPDTQRLLDAAAFGRMKPGTVLINVGRGTLVDEAALLDALASQHLGGAILDVVATEPLPPDHPLWSMENVIIFPHSASTSVRENERLTELFLDNLERFRQGRPLRNVYDPVRQY